MGLSGSGRIGAERMIVRIQTKCLSAPAGPPSHATAFQARLPMSVRLRPRKASRPEHPRQSSGRAPTSWSASKPGTRDAARLSRSHQTHRPSAPPRSSLGDVTLGVEHMFSAALPLGQTWARNSAGFPLSRREPPQTASAASFELSASTSRGSWSSQTPPLKHSTV
jgi:hypothetical protein